MIKDLFFGKKYFQKIFRRLFDISIEGMNIGTGGRNLAKNGELLILKHILSKEQRPIIFDVGAQGGEYIAKALGLMNKGHIYAFEPCLRDYQKLNEVFREKAILVKSALGATQGEAILYYPEHKNGLGSLHKPHRGFNQSEIIEIDTVDNFCVQNNIPKITLLKLDVEGNELNCLRGAIHMIPYISYIQFEFSSASRDSRTYFKDIFEFLSSYKIYRILKDGLYEIKSPEKITELLFTTNYLAVRKEISNTFTI